MERQTLVNKINEMNSVSDLLDLLNELWQDDIGENKNLPQPFTLNKITAYKNPNRKIGRYRGFDIPKKSGKSMRHITAPVRQLRNILHYVNKILQAMYQPLPCVTGFTLGRSVIDNAKVHVGKNYVFNLDLKDFFPSISQARIWKKLQCPPFNFRNDEKLGINRRELADVIAGLCCVKDSDLSHPWVLKAPNPDKVYILPQGAPTSPILTNIICERLDRQLLGVAHRFGVDYTRYADDITFSSMHNVYHLDGEFVAEVKRIIAVQGFEINWEKVRLQKRPYRQEVTGLTVNEKPNVTRKYVQELRHILHEWEVKGYFNAFIDFVKHYKAQKGHVKKGNPKLENVIKGKLDYLRMVKGPDDPTFRRLLERFEVLTDGRSASKFHISDSKIRYIVTYTVPVFQEAFGKIFQGKDKESNKYLYFMINDRKAFISYRKKNIDLDNIEKLYVSYCESVDKGKRFYLLHPKIDFVMMEKIDNNALQSKLHNLVDSNFDLKTLLDNDVQ